MFSRGMIGTLVIAVAVTMIFGGIAPRPAQANDTGRILAGLAAGAIVYGLLSDNNNNDRDRNSYQDRDRSYGDRGFYNGNSGSWDYRGRAPQPNRNQGNAQLRRSYNAGYDRGWNNGYDYGYDRGYDNGYDHGRQSNWGCWGY